MLKPIPVFRMIGRKTDIEVVTVIMKLFGNNKGCQPKGTLVNVIP